MLANLAFIIAGLFPPGLEDVVFILLRCWFVFCIAGVLFCIIRIVREVKGLFSFGR